MLSVIMLLRSLNFYFKVYYMFFLQDEFLNTKFLAHKNGTFQRGNLHSVSGGLKPQYLSPIEKSSKCSLLTQSFHWKKKKGNYNPPTMSPNEYIHKWVAARKER